MKQMIIIFLILLVFGIALWYFLFLHLNLQRNKTNLGCKKYGDNYEAVLVAQSGYQCREILRP